MANVLDLRRRIRSVHNTRQITAAMKMVSAAKLRRAQERALAARPYAQMLANVLKSLVSRADIYDETTGEIKHPLLVHRQEKNIALMVISGDKGFAGAFNANIAKAATKFIESRKGRNIDIIAIGRKGRDFLRRRYPVGATADVGEHRRPSAVVIFGDHPGMLAKVNFAEVRDLANEVIQRYAHGEIDSVYIVFNEFKSVLAQRLVVDQVLPIGAGFAELRREQVEEMSEEERRKYIEAAKTAGVGMRAADTEEIDTRAAQFAARQVDYIYEQPAAQLFDHLLPRFVAIQIYRAMLESVAAEHAARMTAMDSATKNASEMIDSLTLTMNRVRQAAITKEIIEIVSGAAAL